jgi:hypothetical protein
VPRFGWAVRRHATIDVVQFPLQELRKIGAVQSKRRIAYGVYRAYQASRADEATTFTAYARDRCMRLELDPIVATTATATLTSFRDLLT